MNAQNETRLASRYERNSPQCHISHDTTGYWELFTRLWRLYRASLDADKCHMAQVQAYKAEIKEMRGVIVRLVDELIELRRRERPAQGR